MTTERLMRLAATAIIAIIVVLAFTTTWGRQEWFATIVLLVTAMFLLTSADERGDRE